MSNVFQDIQKEWKNSVNMDITDTITPKYPIQLSNISKEMLKIEYWKDDIDCEIITIHCPELDYLKTKEIIEHCILYNSTCRIFTPSWIHNCKIVVEIRNRDELIKRIKCVKESSSLITS